MKKLRLVSPEFINKIHSRESLVRKLNESAHRNLESSYELFAAKLVHLFPDMPQKYIIDFYLNFGGFQDILSFSDSSELFVLFEYEIEEDIPTQYYLFGSSITSIYSNTIDFNDVLSAIKGGMEHQVFKCIPGMHPSKLLYAYDGWDGHILLTEHEYNQIVKL